jgi:hypothetical protein
MATTGEDTMKNITQTIESLTKARDGLDMARNDLLEAMHNAGPVEWLLIFDQVEPVTTARNRIDQLLNALKREDEE